MLTNSIYKLCKTTEKTQKSVLCLFNYICICHIFEIATLASLIPFVTIFLRPESINMSSIFGESLQNFYLIHSINIGFLILIFFFIFILASTITRIYLLKLQTSSAMSVGTFLSLNILERFMYMRYEDFSSVSHSKLLHLYIKKRTKLFIKQYSLVYLSSAIA